MVNCARSRLVVLLQNWHAVTMFASVDSGGELMPLVVRKVRESGLDSHLDPGWIATPALADQMLDRELAPEIKIDIGSRPAAADLTDAA